MAKLLSFLSLLIFSSYNVCFGKTLLILGDSLSAGYQIAADQAWPTRLPQELRKLGKPVSVINGSISGDTTGNALARLPGLLKRHHPDVVLIELGANDGLRGFSLAIPKRNLEQIIQTITATGAQPLLMQIRIPPNYGQRYSLGFQQLYPTLAQHYGIPLLPFYLVQIIEKVDWIQPDGLHPNALAQPWIATYMAQQLASYL